jgi:PTS system mannose-specific IIA component
MIGLVVVAHAPFAGALLTCAKHVYGSEPERCVVIDVMPDADVTAELERARQAVIDVDGGDGALVLVDLFGATPCNVAAQLAQPGRVEVVVGTNLSMLLRVLCYRKDMKLAELTEKALSGGASGIMKIASTSPQNQRPFPCDPNQNDPDQ